ncbi:hypothetical protein [Devosia sp. Root436]|uniref:hypothetical protein n=1 Tax=Devosia sp. Root436 TaxID=1736537 RepID=UPI000AE74351|nr:hypothetical protein [Devosia sp. Root436]
MAKDELKTIKFQMMLSESEARALDDWGFAHRIRSRAEAIRRLCQMALIYDDRADGMQELAARIHASEPKRLTANQIADIAIPLAGDVQMLGKARAIYGDGDQAVAMDRIETVREGLKNARDKRTAALAALDEGKTK